MRSDRASDDEAEAAASVVDVAIVGHGPVGATLAGLLGRAGVSVAVFERAEGVFAQPRAVGFDHDAMRLFQRIGIADDLAPHTERFRDTVFLGADGAPIQRVQPIAPPYPLAWTPSMTCDQPGLEAVLRAAVARMPSVRVALGAELQRFEQQRESVQLEVRHADGQLRRHRARWLVGCDGATSTVRRGCGIALDSMDYDEAWIVVDARVDAAALATLPDTNVQYCEPARPSTYIVCPGNHRRWEFMLVAGESRADELTEARLWSLLARWLKPGQARIWRAAAYRFHALVARDWRRGRVLLAGDSAHQTPPFLGQGMCQGLRDAGNLAWRLAAVLRGEMPEQALDAYTEERKPHVEQTTRLAREFGQLMSERNPDQARVRDIRLRARQPGRTPVLVRQELIPGLRAGLLALDAPAAGQVFPQPLVRAQADAPPQRLDELLGPCFRLVVGAQGDVSARAAFERVARAAGWPLQWIAPGPAPATPAQADSTLHEDSDVLARWFEASGCRGVLVRPDHYVYGGFDTPDEAQSLVAACRHALRPTDGAQDRAAPEPRARRPLTT